MLLAIFQGRKLCIVDGLFDGTTPGRSVFWRGKGSAPSGRRAKSHLAAVDPHARNAASIARCCESSFHATPCLRFSWS
jgi:hypothetical protein